MSSLSIFRPDENSTVSEKRHFNFAKWCFLDNWIDGPCRKTITKVDLIKNDEILEKWLLKERELKNSKVIWAFHGTPKVKNVKSIIKDNFDITKLGQNIKNLGDWGAGIYLSEYSSTAIKYSSINFKGKAARDDDFKGVILCKVLVGRQYICPHNTSTGANLQEGYDSHTSPDGRKEIVIFNSDQILPCYVIHIK